MADDRHQSRGEHSRPCRWPRPLPNSASTIVDTLVTDSRRVMLFGSPGIGKSTLATQLACFLRANDRSCQCLSADPGSPAFGIPGMLALGEYTGDAGWELIAQEPLCTLDAGRFRLPLVSAARRLTRLTNAGVLLVDSPGVVRGVAGRELLHGLVEATRVDLVLILIRTAGQPPLADDLAALGVELYVVQAAEAAQRPGKRARARSRTTQWDDYLASATQQEVDLSQIHITGTAPPTDEPDAWAGRQVALLRDHVLVGMGEVVTLAGRQLVLRAPANASRADTLMVRDATRASSGWLESATPFAPERPVFLPPADLLPTAANYNGPRLSARVGAVDVALVNGLFGDPLVHLRLRHQPRSLLFDLGDGSRLSTRIAHQVSDVFVTHAHMDHLGGFLWLMRSRIGDLPPCRLYGPPGLARHVSNLVEGFLWDRIGECGPAFEVSELHGEMLHRFCLRAGQSGLQPVESSPVVDQVLRKEPGFCVRAITLDHHTPVLAYACEPAREFKVRKDRLGALALRPGPWLSDLKRRLHAGDTDTLLELPDGRLVRVAELSRDLILTSPPKRLVYATDLADTPYNRSRLVAFARHAHTMFLEATFTEADETHACANGHLTSRACGAIAQAAGVARLIPFHLSRRYAEDPQVVFEELRSACDRVVSPGPLVKKTPTPTTSRR